MSELYDEAATMTGDDFFSLCTRTETLIDPKAMLDTFDIRDRAIVINDMITEETAERVVRLIRFWNAVDIGEEEPIPIQIFIDTEGGDLFASLSIVAAIELSMTPVVTYNMGKALSGGFLILIAGHERYAAPYATYLFHEGMNANVADAHKFLQEASYYKYQLNLIKQIVLSKTKISEKLYNSHKKDDWWFGNETAIKYGVVKKVMDSFTIPDFDLLREKQEIEDKKEGESNEGENTTN